MNVEWVKYLETEVANKLDDKCWIGLQELYKEIDYLQRFNNELKEINVSHRKYNGELQAKVDELVADKIALKKELNGIKEFNSYDEVGAFKID